MTYYALPDTIAVAAGTIDEESVQGELVKPSNHIFLGEKAKWYTLPEDGLARYDEWPPGFEDALETWKGSVKKL